MNKNDISVGIIIPAYNVENYIVRALDSCINQTYCNIEVIIVDDGSVDGTFEKAKQYEEKDRRVYVYQQKNAGVSTARNRGLELCNAKYVIFLDSDDWLELNTIETLIKYIPKDNDNFLISADAYYAKFNKDEIQKHKAPYMSDSTVLEAKEALTFIAKQQYKLRSACYKLYSMEVIRNKRLFFDTQIRHGEDGLFVFEYLKSVEKFIYFPDPLWNILERPGSATQSPYNKYWLTSLDAVDKMLHYDNEENLNIILRNYKIQRMESVLCEAVLYFKDTKDDIKMLRAKLRKEIPRYIKEEQDAKRKLYYLFVTFSPRVLLYLYCRRKVRS